MKIILKSNIFKLDTSDCPETEPYFYYWTWIIHKETRYIKDRSGPVNTKSFVGTIFLRIKWKFELQLKAIVVSFDVWRSLGHIYMKILN